MLESSKTGKAPDDDDDNDDEEEDEEHLHESSGSSRGYLVLPIRFISSFLSSFLFDK